MPFIFTQALLPPLGFILFIAWRMHHRSVWIPWIGSLLGLFDDLCSMMGGQAPGTAMVLWPLALVGLWGADRWFDSRDYRGDWGIASALTALYLIAALGIANILGGKTPFLVIVPQIMLSVLLLPLVLRLAARIDIWRYS